MSKNKTPESSPDPIGDRMKRYEKATRTVVTPRTPVIIRVDGKSFHTYTRELKNPFDRHLSDAMERAAVKLCDEIQGAQCAYTQSDEISVLIHTYKRFNSSAWFDGQIQKMASVAASIAAATITAMSEGIFGSMKAARFDARVFALPEAEVANYFVWRQQDCIRNSVQSLARQFFSHKQCDHKDQVQLKEMLLGMEHPWERLANRWRYGVWLERELYATEDESVRSRWRGTDAVPVFQVSRHTIERHLETEE